MKLPFANEQNPHSHCRVFWALFLLIFAKTRWGYFWHFFPKSEKYDRWNTFGFLGKKWKKNIFLFFKKRKICNLFTWYTIKASFETFFKKKSFYRKKRFENHTSYFDHFSTKTIPKYCGFSNCVVRTRISPVKLEIF